MQVPRAETLEVKAETPRSERLPRRMAAGEAALAQALAAPAQAEGEAVSGQKVPRQAARQLTARAVVAVVARQQE